MKNRLRELRQERELTQQQLAEALQVSRQTVISIERKARPQLATRISDRAFPERANRGRVRRRLTRQQTFRKTLAVGSTLARLSVPAGAGLRGVMRRQNRRALAKAGLCRLLCA